MWKNHSNLTKKKAFFTLYVIDINWLKTEIWEEREWRVIPFDKIIHSLLEDEEEKFLNLIASGNTYPGFYLVKQWEEKRKNLLRCLETLLDTENIQENFEYFKWLSVGTIVLKKKEVEFKPPDYHLMNDVYFKHRAF